MSRRKKPRLLRSPPSQSQEAWRPYSEWVNGHLCEGFEISSTQTGTRVLFVGEVLLFKRWWYHPAYDEAPNTDEFQVGIRDFLDGKSQRSVLLELGAEVFEHLLGLCQAKHPDVKAVNLRVSDDGKVERNQGNCGVSGLRFQWWPQWMEWLNDRFADWQGSCHACWGLLVVVLFATLVSLSSSLTWWWHGRVLKDLQAHTAQVLIHDLSVSQRSVGGGHKKPPTGVTYVFTPVIHLELESSKTVLMHRLNAWPTLESRTQAQQWMQTHHPLGQRLTIWTLPTEVTADTVFVLSPDKTPDFWRLLGEAVIQFLLMGFIYLPLLVLALLIAGVLMFAVASKIGKRFA
ncbi:MAG: hypothetical protein RLZZ612_1409 [Pseudomonadota bacterium]|jgi:hypothetical protein